MKLHRGAFAALTMLVIFVIAVGVRRSLSEAGRSSTDDGPQIPESELVGTVVEAGLMDSQPVEGVAVVRDTLWQRVIASGLAEPSRASAVATRSSGVILDVHVREGDSVQTGDILVQLDTALIALNLLRAEATLAQAEAQYRERLIGGSGILSREEEERRERIVRAETGLIEAELDREQSLIDLELTRVRAPFAGRVADLRAVEGGFLSNGGEVLTLLQLDPIRVRVEVKEGEIGLLAPGRRASVRFNALGGESRVATVESVNPLVDPQTRTGRITLSLPNPGHRILAGSSAAVTLDARAFPDRILIPREAVLTRGDRKQQVVFVLRDLDPQGHGIAELRHVALGRRNDTYVEVVPSGHTSMLEPGEIVLTNRHQFLALGTRVHLTRNLSH